MLKKRKIFLIIFIILSFPLLGLLSFFYNNPILVKTFMRKYISPSFMDDISKYILPYREIKLLERENRFLNKLEDYGIENDIEIKDSLVVIKFEKSEEKKLKGTKLILDKFYPKEVTIMRGIYDKFPGSAYLEGYKNNLYLLSSTGILGYSRVENNILNFVQIKNNIQDFIGYDQFKKSSKFSIKDLLIKDEKIFLSFTNEIKNDCWNTSIIYGELNPKVIQFKPFFTPEECVSSKNNEDRVFEALQSGGRISDFSKNEIIFSTGEFRSRSRAQDIGSIMGKILKINIQSKKYKNIAIGSRNAQGLYFDKKNKIIISTEHGPKGGDEINIIKVTDDENIVNLGWPISSYGEHYLSEKERLNGWNFEENNPYIKYPLYKSHKKYGFKEPVKFYIPSIGISQVVAINEFKKVYCHVSLVDNSIYFFDLDKDFKINNSLRFNIEERIRDVIKFDQKLIFFLESSSSIGIIDLEGLYESLENIF